MRRLLFQTIHDIALMLDREQARRRTSPSAGVLDSQTVKVPHAPDGSSYDAAKRTKWRKRHIAVDTDGRLLMVSLTTADVQDAAGAEKIVAAVRRLPGQIGFQVLPRCWMVERTFNWVTRWRRLARDYEKHLDVSRAMIHVSMDALLLQRVAYP